MTNPLKIYVIEIAPHIKKQLLNVRKNFLKKGLDDTIL